MTRFLTAVRHEVNNLESSVVVQELEFAINRALYGVLSSPKSWSDGHPPGNGQNAFPTGFTTQAKENTRFYAAENTLLHNFHQATCPIKHMICL